MTILKSLSAAATKAATPKIGAERTRDVLQGGQIKVVGGQARLYGTDSTNLVREGYKLNSDLYSVIDYIVRKAVQAKFFLYKIVDEKAFDDFVRTKALLSREQQRTGKERNKGTIEQLSKKAEELRTKALEDATHPQIDKLLANPNPEQDIITFLEACFTYKLLFGERFIHVIPGLYPASRMYALPPSLVEVKGGDSYLQISGYTYTPSQTNLTSEEVVFSRKFNPALDGYGDELRGLSPLRVLAFSIQKSNEGKISGLSQYQNQGPPGIISLTDKDKDVQLTTEQAKQYEDQIARKSGSRNRGRPIVTQFEAKYTPLGMSPVDLDILQSSLFDLRDFCRVYGLDSKVLSDPSSSTYNNMAEARKAAIVDVIIPAVNSQAADFNKIFSRFNNATTRYWVEADVSHFPELAEDLNQIMDRMMKGPFSPNQVLEAMQYPPLDNPLMNEPWMGNDRTPLSQFTDPGDGGKEGENDGSY